MKFIIAFDSFKECMQSREAGKIAERAIKKHFPDAEIKVFAMADGGEGTAEILASYCDADKWITNTHDALFNPISADYYLNHRTKEAFIDFASASGLARIAPSQRDPFVASSYGTGELINHAIANGAKKITLCFGCSATNDGGIGLLQVLGAKFYNKDGKNLPIPIFPSLIPEISKIDFSPLKKLCGEVTFTGLYDTIVPFCGTPGASLVFAPQKGASHEEAQVLDYLLAKLRLLYADALGMDCPLFPGSGAAGGAAGALGWVLGADLQSGSRVIIGRSGIASETNKDTIVITGEGKSDSQTLTGKLPGELLSAAKENNIPVYLFSGAIEDSSLLRKAGFKEVYAITPPGMPLEEALRKEIAEKNLFRAVDALIL